MNLSQKIFQYLTIKNYLNRSFLLGVSGGVDSMVMLKIFHELGLNFVVAHCNFGLRGAESDADEQLVKNYCNIYKIKYLTIKFDTKKSAEQNKTSIQIEARNLRYAWFYKLVTSENLDFIVTAHHQNDSVETFLINLSRSTGLEGLLGIPEKNNQIIRPFLGFSKHEILDFAHQKNILFREDSSNASDKYLRNVFRHNIIPELEKINPNFYHSFQETIDHLSDSQEFINEQISIILKNIIVIENNQQKLSIQKLITYQSYKFILFKWLKPFDFKAWNDIYALVEAQTGKQIFSKNHSLLKNRNELILQPKTTENQLIFEIDEQVTKLKVPLNISFKKVDSCGLNTKKCIFVERNLLQFPLVIKKYAKGDYFYPAGMKGKKKISKFFKDEKLSLVEKENTWVLYSDNQVVWIIDRRADQRFLATHETKNILRIENK